MVELEAPVGWVSPCEVDGEGSWRSMSVLTDIGR